MNDSTRCTNVDVWGQRCLRESHDDWDCLFAIAPEPPVPAAPAPEATREADDVAMLLDEMDADVCMFDEIRGDPDKDTSDFFPNTLDLIRRLRAAIDAERAAQAREIETLRADAERWRT